MQVKDMVRKLKRLEQLVFNNWDYLILEANESFPSFAWDIEHNYVFKRGNELLSVDWLYRVKSYEKMGYLDNTL